MGVIHTFLSSITIKPNWLTITSAPDYSWGWMSLGVTMKWHIGTFLNCYIARWFVIQYVGRYCPRQRQSEWLWWWDWWWGGAWRPVDSDPIVAGAAERERKNTQKRMLIICILGLRHNLRAILAAAGASKDRKWNGLNALTKASNNKKTKILFSCSATSLWLSTIVCAFCLSFPSVCPFLARLFHSRIEAAVWPEPPLGLFVLFLFFHFFFNFNFSPPHNSIPQWLRWMAQFAQTHSSLANLIQFPVRLFLPHLCTVLRSFAVFNSWPLAKH